MALKASARGQVSPFIVMDVMRAAAEHAAAGNEVLHMEVGQPGTSAPRKVIEAAHQALETDVLGYTDALGIPPLRAAIARHYKDFYGVDVSSERIIVTTGSSGGFLLAFFACFDPGARVALALPCYPAYRNMLAALDIELVLLPATVEDRFQPTVELLERAGDPPDGLILTSPSNPAGTMVSPETLAELSDYCRAKGIRLISDEIYHGITYGSMRAATAATAPEAFVVNSFSKYFSMTGWRIGWMVVPDDMRRPIECLTQNLYISTPALSQLAALAAFDAHEELRENVAAYARNRQLLLDKLPQAGFERLAPADGAFYIYADVSQLTNDSPAFCKRMLSEANVAATPGVDFDPQRGNHFVRFSFAGTHEEIERAAEQLIEWQGGRGS